MAKSDELVAALGGRTPTDAEAVQIENARTLESQAKGEGRNIGQTADAERSAASIIADGGASRTGIEGDLKASATKEVDREAIREEERKAVGTQIDVIDEIFSQMLAEEAEAGEERLGRGRAIRSRGGLLESSFGEAQVAKTRALNRRVVEGLQAQKRVEVLSVLDRADQRARERTALELSEKREDRDAFLALLQQQQEESREDIATLASSGLELERLQPEQRAELERQSGFFGAEFDAVYGKSFREGEITLTEEQKAQQRADLDIAKRQFDIAKQIPFGETFSPEGTDLIIIGTKEEEPETMDIVQTVGNEEFKIRFDLSDPENPRELFRIPLGQRWKGGGTETSIDNITTIDEAIVQTVEYLNSLKQQGQFNDITNNVAINALAAEYGIENVGELQSIINQKLEGSEKFDQVNKDVSEGKTVEEAFKNVQLFPGFSVSIPTKAGVASVVAPFDIEGEIQPEEDQTQTTTPKVIL